MSTLPPIGIVTRNRIAYLDVTLRSLTATELPAGQPLIVYDDHSDDEATKRYLYGSEPVDCGRGWPRKNPWWRKMGLNILNERNVVPHGLAGKVRVETLDANRKIGVVNASCRAIVKMFAEFPDAPGVFLLQDDEIFNANWYNRMLETAGKPTPNGVLGMLSGCRLNKPARDKDKAKSVVFLSKSTTAQCLYITRAGFDGARGWLEGHHKENTGFDNHICKHIRRGNHTVCLIQPFVCQHIGIVSLVRPKVTWTSRGQKGRVGYSARPPYALADHVKQFI
jgi:glycosyltransferase involved in cell wall biosynthesis